MHTEIAARLGALNSAFYRENADSFSATRHAPWAGWERCAALMNQECFAQQHAVQKSFSVLDLACGNMRFETYCAEKLPAFDLTFYAVDDCDGLIPETNRATYQSLDILGALGAEVSLAEALQAPLCDVSVCFGFMHHIPLFSQREQVLRAMVGKTRPGGLVIVSFWQFMNSEQLAAKASLTHERALRELHLPPLDEGDYILGWKDVPGAYRYCHHFSSQDVDELLTSISDLAVPFACFDADGRTGELNAYRVLRVG